MKRSILLLSTILTNLAFVLPIYAQTNESWTEVNLSVVDHQIIPRYAKFAASSLRLAELNASFCSAVNQNSLLELQQAFHASLDDWEAIQHVQFGPITYFNWNYRLQYWPDEKGTGGRQLTSLITSGDQSVLDSRSFSRQSVGIQGFPALERILFAETALADLQGDVFRCQVSQTISGNISEIASGAEQRWVDEFRATVENADDSDDFESAEDATIDLLKALVETVPKIQDQKLVPVLGNSFASSRVRRAESWRSQRSIRNLKINISSLAQLFLGSGEETALLSSVLLAEDVELIQELFTDIEVNLAPLPDAMSAALQNEAQYTVLTTVLSQMLELDEVLETALKNTDLYLGFNSLDGD